MEGSARSVVQFEGILLQAAPCVEYSPADLYRHFGVVVYFFPEAYELVCFVVYLVGCLYAEYTDGLRHSICV